MRAPLCLSSSSAGLRTICLDASNHPCACGLVGHQINEDEAACCRIALVGIAEQRLLADQGYCANVIEAKAVRRFLFQRSDVYTIPDMAHLGADRLCSVFD